MHRFLLPLLLLLPESLLAAETPPCKVIARAVVYQDEGRTWSEPAIVADRPAPKPGWSICYPSATELPDGTLALIWTQIRNIPGTLHGDIHAARVRLTDR